MLKRSTLIFGAITLLLTVSLVIFIVYSSLFGDDMDKASDLRKQYQQGEEEKEAPKVDQKHKDESEEDEDKKQAHQLQAAWPKQAFVVSIREKRLAKCVKRLSFLPPQVQVVPWAGTDGRKIDKKEWLQKGWIKDRHLRRGQLGCFDSHLRIWRSVVEQNLDQAIIFEDDVGIEVHHLPYVDRALANLQAHDPDWDVFYLALHKYKPCRKRRLTEDLAVPLSNLIGTFAYMVSQRGARKLMTGALPMVEAVDMYITRMAPSLRLYCTAHNVFFVTVTGALNSDTKLIH